MKQLNLVRESIFNRDMVLIFWLNKSEFLEEFSNRAPDFWDWRNKVVSFETHPVLNPLLYSYLERLIAENSYLKISGVMQVQRQVDIFLDHYIALSLLISERLRLLPHEASSLQKQVAQFEENYNIALSYLEELGQTVDKTKQVLDIARAYIEVGALENIDKAEQLAQESLTVFQEYNHRQLEASAYKLLGEIYLKRRERNHSNVEVIATQFLTESLQIYRALDLQEKASKVELLCNFGE